MGFSLHAACEHLDDALGAILDDLRAVFAKHADKMLQADAAVTTDAGTERVSLLPAPPDVPAAGAAGTEGSGAAPAAGPDPQTATRLDKLEATVGDIAKGIESLLSKG